MQHIGHYLLEPSFLVPNPILFLFAGLITATYGRYYP